MSLTLSTDLARGPAAPSPVVGRTRPAEPVVRRLSRLAPLSAEDLALLDTVAARRERHDRNAELNRQGERVCTPRMILSGWAARVRTLADGRRQVISLLLPGDLSGVTPGPSPLSLAPTVALTPGYSAEASALAEAAGRRRAEHPGLARALDLAASAEVACIMDHVARLGRMTAYERTLHWLLELYTRLKRAGLAEGGRCRLPLTQDVMADVLGVSVVHLNRTLRQLRGDSMISLEGGRLVLPDLDRAASVCGFERVR
jgi:CRP-like cAMP-binding protein